MARRAMIQICAEASRWHVGHKTYASCVCRAALRRCERRTPKPRPPRPTPARAAPGPASHLRSTRRAPTTQPCASNVARIHSPNQAMSDRANSNESAHVSARNSPSSERRTPRGSSPSAPHSTYAWQCTVRSPPQSSSCAGRSLRKSSSG
ncbi:hypothetical protein M885DRAFT_530471 [Pelagophyceae sp. CCMP2097]|nr:hypothetical protein M885DRAFT_530471 [Pelagophyceae sp. CCMP2097]